MTEQVVAKTEAAVAEAEEAVAAGNVSLAELASRLGKSARARSSTATPDTSVSATSGKPEGDDAGAEVPGGENQQTDGEPAGEAETVGEVEHAAGAEPEGEPTNDGDGKVEQEQESSSGASEGEEELPRGVKELQARVNKLTARAKAAEAALEEAKAAAAAPGEEGGNVRARQEPRPTEVGNAHPALAKLDGELAVMDKVLAFAKANPNGGVLRDNGVEVEFDAEKLAAIREDAIMRKSALIAERTATAHEIRRAHAEAEAKFSQEAVAAYPWLVAKDAESAPKRQEFEQYVQMLPEIRRFPDYKVWVSDAMAGREARLARAKAGKAPQERRPTLGAPMVKPKGANGQPAPIVARPGAAAPRVSGAQRAVKEAQGEFVKSGDVRSLAKVLSASAAARRSAA